MSTKEKKELTKLSPYLFIIAVMYTLHRTGIEKIEQDILLELLVKGALRVMKDEDWKVDGFVIREPSLMRRPRLTLEVDESGRSEVFLETMVEQSVLLRSFEDGATFYRLSDHVADELRDPETRDEMGLGELIVMVACTPARSWGKKHRPGGKGLFLGRCHLFFISIV